MRDEDLAMPGMTTLVADLCMFGLAACDEGGPGFSHVSVRTVTTARQVEMRMQRKCTDTHRHAHVDADDTSEKTGTWVHPEVQAMEEQLREDEQDLKTREAKKEVKDAKRIRGIFHANDKNKGTGRVLGEMENLMHHDEQELLSLWEGWHCDDHRGGCLDLELFAKASTSVVTRCPRECPERRACVRLGKQPSRQDGRRLTRDNQGSPVCA